MTKALCMLKRAFRLTEKEKFKSSVAGPLHSNSSVSERGREGNEGGGGRGEECSGTLFAGTVDECT